MKEQLVLLFQLLFLGFLCLGQDKSIPRYWVNKDIEWKKTNTGDPELDSIVEATTINAIIFHPVGKFIMLSSNGGQWGDSTHQYADIFRIYKGTWKNKTSNVLELSYTLIRENLNNESPTTTVILDLDKNEFEFEGLNYIKGDKLTSKTKQRLDNFALHVKSKKK
ncbi:hypothetical protein [Nibribacter koreensis]